MRIIKESPQAITGKGFESVEYSFDLTAYFYNGILTGFSYMRQGPRIGLFLDLYKNKFGAKSRYGFDNKFMFKTDRDRAAQLFVKFGGPNAQTLLDQSYEMAAKDPSNSYLN